MIIDPKQISPLLASDKSAELKNVVKQAVSADLTPAEQGAALTGIATISLDVSNNVNARYRDALAAAIVGLQKLKNAEVGLDDEVRIVEVKESLSQQ